MYVLILLSFSQRTEYPPSRTMPPPIPFTSLDFARLPQVLPSSVPQKAWSSASGTVTDIPLSHSFRSLSYLTDDANARHRLAYPQVLWPWLPLTPGHCVHSLAAASLFPTAVSYLLGRVQNGQKFWILRPCRVRRSGHKSMRRHRSDPCPDKYYTYIWLCHLVVKCVDP